MAFPWAEANGGSAGNSPGAVKYFPIPAYDLPTRGQALFVLCALFHGSDPRALRQRGSSGGGKTGGLRCAVGRGQGFGGSPCVPVPSAAPRGSHRTLLVSFLSPSCAPDCFIIIFKLLCIKLIKYARVPSGPCLRPLRIFVKKELLVNGLPAALCSSSRSQKEFSILVSLG